jgi:hypothetical protein
MLTAAIELWLLPATLIMDAFLPSLPSSTPVTADIIPITSNAHRVRRKRKVIRSKRGD